MNHPKVKSQLNQFIKDFKNATKEYGFNIIRTPEGYNVSAIVAGDHNSVSLDISDDVVATVHNYPLGGSSVHSSTDIYGLFDYIDNLSYLGSIVVRDDDMHVLSITNKEQYMKFYQLKDKYYDKYAPYGWKKDSKIEKEFNSFSADYLELYKGVDATYPTQLYLMNKYKMGVSLQKWDGTNFNPLKTNAKYKSGTGSSTTIGGGGQTINSRYESITIEVNCKNKK